MNAKRRGNIAASILAFYSILGGITPAHGYVVQKGDTLSEIAKSHGLPHWNELARINGVKNKDKIEIGQYLQEPPGWVFKKGEVHSVEEGDTLSRLERLYRTTIEDILILNPNIGNSDRIEVGQKIYIPKNARNLSVQEQKKQIKGHPHLERLIYKVCRDVGIPVPRLVDMVIRSENEPLSHMATRYEPAFQKKYVEPMLAVNHKGNFVKNNFLTRMFFELKKENPEYTLRQFIVDCSHSYGLGQPMGLVAYELGYKGPLRKGMKYKGNVSDGLQGVETNLYWTARRIWEHRKKTKFLWDEVAWNYNTGLKMPKGRPHPGYMGRSERNWNQSQVEKSLPQSFAAYEKSQIDWN